MPPGQSKGCAAMRWEASTRLRVADLLDEGLGYKAIASRLGISREAVREWAYAYRALGREGLCAVGSRRRYRAETKLAAARDRLEGGLSVVAVMAKYGVANRRQVKEWCSQYLAKGPAAFGGAADAAGAKPPAPNEGPGASL